MPIPLIQPLIAEKNKVSQEQPWLLFLQLTSVDGNTIIRLVRNTENITYKGDEYIAFPFEVDPIPESSSGSLPTFALKVSNVDKQVQRAIEADATYGSGWDVKLTLAHVSELNGTVLPDKVAEIEQEWESLDLIADEEIVTINLGMPNPMLIQFPKQKYSGGFCQRTFNDGRGCPYQAITPVPFYLYNNIYPTADIFTFPDGNRIEFTASGQHEYLNDRLKYYDDPNVQAVRGFGLHQAMALGLWVTPHDIINPPITGQWLQWEYSIPTRIVEIETYYQGGYNTDSGYNTSPARTYQIQASNDGIGWTTLATANTDVSTSTPIVSHGLYKYYRIYLHDTAANTINPNASAATIKNIRIKTQNETNFTTCNKTLSACRERFPTGRINSLGQKIGLPFLGFNGIISRAIYGT